MVFNNKIKNHIKPILLITFISLTIILVERIFADNIVHSYELFTINTRYFYYAIITLAVAFYLGGKSKVNNLLIIIFFAAIGILTIFVDKAFSVIDEGAHFDYINQIVVNYKLPTLLDSDIPTGIINHEAVQPPFYYMIMALLTFLIKDYAIRFLFIRCMGLLILFGIIFMAFKTLNILYKNNIIYLNYNETFYFVILFLMNPGILLRFTRVSNESLTVLLSSLIVYVLVKALFDCFYDKLWWICNVLLISIFLSKNTGIILITGMVIILFYQKKYIRIIQSCIVFVLGISPWFLYNFFLYHSFTGMREHLEYVIPIVNPDRVREDLVPHIINLFINYINPQETGFNVFNFTILTFVSFAIFLIVVLFSLYSMKKCYYFIKNKFKFNYERSEKEIILIILITLIIVENIFILIFASYTTFVNVLIGRYLYLSAIPLIIIGILWIQNKEEYVRKLTYIIIGLALSSGYISSIGTVLNSYVVH